MAFDLATEDQIDRLAGANISASVTEAMKQDWELQCSHVLSALCRRDWITDTIDTNYTQIISNTVGSMVAMMVINYDLSAVPTRSEAETRLDKLDNDIRRNLKILQEKTWQDEV